MPWRNGGTPSMESTDNSFGGSIEAGGGPGNSSAGIGGGNGIGSGAAGGGDMSGIGTSADAMGLGSMAAGATQTTLADFNMLSAITALGLTGYFGPTGWTGAVLGPTALVLATYGTTPDIAIGHLAHDLAMGFNSSTGNNAAIFGGPQ